LYFICCLTIVKKQFDKYFVKPNTVKVFGFFFSEPSIITTSRYRIEMADIENGEYEAEIKYFEEKDGF
jgi:hypothetical protein